MTRYVRPDIKKREYEILGLKNVMILNHDIKQRFVTKPLRGEVTPHQSYGCRLTNAAWGHLDSTSYLKSSDVSSIFASVYGIRNDGPVDFRPLNAASLNKCYDRFRDKVTDFAQLGETLGERKQAVSMIVDRATSLRLGYRDLRRGDFQSFLRRFRIREKPSNVRKRSLWTRPRDASSLWLEYHYGWSPLVADIYTAIRLLEMPFPVGVAISASATARSEFRSLNYGNYGRLRYLDCKTSTKMGAVVDIENPNLFQATQLGVTNPAAIAWELMPFSAIVDWVFPVGNFLNSYTDFLGLSFRNPYTTRYISGRDLDYNKHSNYPPTLPNHRPELWQETGHRAWRFDRYLGISKPVVYPKIFKGFSVTRGATAISLLLQVLKPGGKI